MTELLVAVAVVGLLMAIAVPHFTRARTESSVRQAEIELELLSTAIGELAWDTGEWPGGIPRTTAMGQELWDLSVPAAGLITTDGRFDRWQGAYIDKLPRDPWGKSYFFDPDYQTGGKTHVVVGSFGPNRRGKNEYDDDDIIVILK